MPSPPPRTSHRSELILPVPMILKPLLRAYVLGYASAVAPRILTLFLQHLSRRRQRKLLAETTAPQPSPSFLQDLKRIVTCGLELQRFPTFCAALVGGTTLLEVPLRRLLELSFPSLSRIGRLRLSRWLSSFVAGWLSLNLLQSKRTDGFSDTVVAKTDCDSGVQCKTVHYAGRTLDLTLFAATRALDVIVGHLWAQRKKRRVAARKWTKIEALISSVTDPAIFATSSALIMWTWIYLPSRLPRAYNKWISSAAAVDHRLIQALQRCRTGELQYGKETGQATLLQSMCKDYGWPMDWGNPAKTAPFPCEMVHMGCGPSCELHALSRFYRSWRWAMATYLPLNLLLVLRRPGSKALKTALISAARSSAFLGAFITIFYYGVCLTRTRVGPRLLGRDFAATQAIDGGICSAVGCSLCGWSIYIENGGRRKDLGLFVAPRALATLFPRRYAMDKQWRETLVFAASTAVVFTCILENKQRVRGLLGNLLHTVLET